MSEAMSHDLEVPLAVVCEFQDLVKNSGSPAGGLKQYEASHELYFFFFICCQSIKYMVHVLFS